MCVPHRRVDPGDARVECRGLARVHFGTAVPPLRVRPTLTPGVVVGDGAVGKVRRTRRLACGQFLREPLTPDMSAHLVHDQLVPGGVSPEAVRRGRADSRYVPTVRCWRVGGGARADDGQGCRWLLPRREGMRRGAPCSLKGPCSHRPRRRDAGTDARSLTTTRHQCSSTGDRSRWGYGTRRGRKTTSELAPDLHHCPCC